MEWQRLVMQKVRAAACLHMCWANTPPTLHWTPLRAELASSNQDQRLTMGSRDKITSIIGICQRGMQTRCAWSA